MTVWPGYEPLHLAQRRGLLDKERVRLVSYRSATQAMRALESNAIDACTLTLDEVVTLTCGGVPLTIVLVMDVSSGSDCIIGQKDITVMTDLRGKRIAVESTALGALMLLRALEMSGLSESDVVPVWVEVARHVDAFKEGKIDASVCFEPTRSTLLAQGGNELFTSAEMPGEIVDVIAVRTESLREHEMALRHLGASWDRALKLLDDAPEESYEILGERMGKRGDEVRAAYAGLTLYTRDASATFLSSPTFVNETLPRLITFMADRALVTRKIFPAIDQRATFPKDRR